VKRLHRLRTAAEFSAVRGQAERAWPHRLLVLYVAPNDLRYPRVGITVSGRVGNAVKRNRVRRRLRELLRARLARLEVNDLLVIARPGSADATWPQLTEALDTLLARAGATHSQSVGV
jgi:ribonuclease P protein component